MNIQTQLDARFARRTHAENRYLDRLEKKERAAEHLIGELCREGKTIYYINLRDRQNRLTGKIKESASAIALIDYLIRNDYI
jgi:hypothetical protein